jgi:hypothetical protein
MKVLLALFLMAGSAQGKIVTAADKNAVVDAVADVVAQVIIDSKNDWTKKDYDSIAGIKKDLVSFDVLKGNFEQSKKIKIIKKPLKSYGDFILVKNKGLLWRTSKPLVSAIRITQDDIVSLGEGKKVVFVSMKDQPALRVIGKILFALFATDVDELQRHFKFTKVLATPESWSVMLTPNDANVAKVIRYVDISGAKTVHKLILFEANGDSTEINFKDVASKKPLTKEEEALFE